MASFEKQLDEAKIVAAIGVAEQRTSGEIRVVIARARAEDPVAAARQHFERLGMTGTKARNGVLIFIAPVSHTFAVIGDTGIHEKCGQPFWAELTRVMATHFQSGDFSGGILTAINRAGELLSVHFPRQPDDRNELPNAVERG